MVHLTIFGIIDHTSYKRAKLLYKYNNFYTPGNIGSTSHQLDSLHQPHSHSYRSLQVLFSMASAIPPPHPQPHHNFCFKYVKQDETFVTTSNLIKPTCFQFLQHFNSYSQNNVKFFNKYIFLLGTIT